MDRRKRVKKILSEALCWNVIALLFVSGCANYASRVRASRDLINQGHFDRAISELKILADKQDNDELLYLMDLGIAYHGAKQYKEAVKTFLKADKLAEIVDYTSLSQEIGSVLLNDSVKKYKGEHFENILINSYLAMDYALSGEWDDALVECRRVNQKLEKFINEGGLPYQRNAFAKYLAAILFEARREYNDAFVDYRQLAKWPAVDRSLLSIPLLRMSQTLRADQEFEQYSRDFGKVNYQIKKGEGEIVLLLELGRGPFKVPHEVSRLLPRFQKNYFMSQSAVIHVGERSSESSTWFDIEGTAIRELDHKIGLILAKKVVGVVAKEIIAREVYKKNEALGILAAIALRASDQADLRSWSTLPARLQIARLVVPAGRHEVKLDRVANGQRSLSQIWPSVAVKSQEIVFLNFRMMD